MRMANGHGQVGVNLTVGQASLGMDLLEEILLEWKNNSWEAEY